MTSPFLTADEAASYLRLFTKDGSPNKRALYEHLRRHQVRVYHIGSRVRYHVDDIQALIVPSHWSAKTKAS
jgi:hypothetical protein